MAGSASELESGPAETIRVMGATTPPPPPPTPPAPLDEAPPELEVELEFEPPPPLEVPELLEAALFSGSLEHPSESATIALQDDKRSAARCMAGPFQRGGARLGKGAA
jgi:hypothetical protein